jgi:hypothetical protein
LTWRQVFLFTEHARALISGIPIDYDEEPPPLEGAFIRSDGARVRSV